MSHDTFIGKFRSFFGLQPEPPRPEFRNPIWGSDDDDDGDELYNKQNIDVYSEAELHRMLTRHMQDMFKSFGGMFGNMKYFFDGIHTDSIGTTTEFPDHELPHEQYHNNSIRDYYLKPGYQGHEERKDMDLDGEISSQEISGLLKKKDDSLGHSITTIAPFDGSLVPGRSFCQTVITTSVRKSDGSVETRRIVKNGNEIIEETTTSRGPDARGPQETGYNTVPAPGIIISELASLFRNFY